MVYHNLKALIKGIRACKTVADERALIQQESAAIRAAFREEDASARHNNVAKLLYIHMLGQPAHFGQIEALKLVAQPKFGDKRLGYLGIMLLLDESQEVLTLVTNSLKNDMAHANMYAVGLALCAFANIASEEMARDLAHEVERLLGSANAYIRKKACLCALRVVKKVPELAPSFLAKTKNLLTDRNHGVLLAATTLAIDMCAADPAGCLPELRAAAPLLVRQLKNLVATGYSPEHDVAGITDPFLQVKLLRLLARLGAGTEPLEAVNDVLAQVATNTDGAKNAGNAILYETVRTVLDVDAADAGLRVMAINILGRFLSNKDNNVRYVALNTLARVVGLDTGAVQRHRSTILDCLRDGDISIRRRALELSYALVNAQNVRAMARELLAFLAVADNEFKPALTTQLSLAAERFAPTRRWHIDTVLRTLSLAGGYVREDILAAFIRLVAHTPELQAYTASRLYRALEADISQEGLTLAAAWIIGEYADVLVDGGLVDGDAPTPVTDVQILDLLTSILDSPYAGALTRQFVFTAVTKVAARPRTAPAQQARVSALLAAHTSSPELEIQQRAVEFASLFALGDVRQGVLERMPAPEIRATLSGAVAERRSLGSTAADADLLGDDAPGGIPSGPSAPAAPAAPAQSNQDLLAEIFGAGPADAAPAAAAPAAAPQRRAVDDILGLFGATAAPASAPSPAPAAPAASQSLFDALGAAPAPAAPAPAPAPAQAQAQQPPSYPAYDKHGLSIRLTPRAAGAQAPGHVAVLARFAVTSGAGVRGLAFQVAVPRSQQLHMSPLSSPDVAPGKVESQQMRIVAPPGSAIKLRLRISFTTADGTPVQDQVDFAGFPPGLTGGA